MADSKTPPAPPAPWETGSKETVTVACKLPHGLVLRLFRMADREEQQPMGLSRSIKIAEPIGPRVVLNGYTQKYKADLPPQAVSSSYALTHGVPKDFFDHWMEQNREHEAVVNHLIFAHTKSDEVVAQTREFESVRNGLEPVDTSRLKGKIRTYDKDAA